MIPDNPTEDEAKAVMLECDIEEFLCSLQWQEYHPFYREGAEIFAQHFLQAYHYTEHENDLGHIF